MFIDWLTNKHIYLMRLHVHLVVLIFSNLKSFFRTTNNDLNI